MEAGRCFQLTALHRNAMAMSLFSVHDCSTGTLQK